MPDTSAQQSFSISEQVAGARSDEEFRNFLTSNRRATVIAEYGSTWCAHCQEMFPHFQQLAKQYPQHKYVLAQIDYMDQELKGIRYSPTFAVFKQGRKVDQFYGAEPQQLRDHIWLHSEST